jgi:hypothetical protein
MKMRRFNFNYKTFIFGFLALPLVFLFVTACLEIKSVDASDSARAGSTQTVTLNVLLDTENNDQNWKRLVIGVCAPKEWKVGENAVVTFDSPLNNEPRVGKGTMILDDGAMDKGYKKGRGADGNQNGLTWAANAEEILGFDENYGEMEWVMYYSDQVDAGNTSVEGTVSISLKVGSAHSAAKLGYWVGVHDNGFKMADHIEASTTTGAPSRWYDYEWKKMAITGASADATDLTGPAPTYTATVAAGANGYTFDDIITIGFDAKEGYLGANTALYNAGEVYMCATALLGDGTTVAKVDRSASAKMTLSGADTWSKTIWPPAYFGVSNQIITEIHLNFQNADGSIVVKNPGYGTDMVFGEKCQ